MNDRQTLLGKRPIFYGWYIVAVGFLCHIASTFPLSSTLSIFLKPVAAELGVSRGVFSLLRTGEALISAFIAPALGRLVDRHGARWLVAIGALVAGSGFLLLSQVQNFWQFVLIRWIPVGLGSIFFGYMIVNVAISNWFICKRGRAVAIANTGTGLAKIIIPLLAGWLFVVVGWRHAWSVFGILTIALVVAPALILMQRQPEDMGLHPDGSPVPYDAGTASQSDAQLSESQHQALRTDVFWTRAEALHTRTFWLLVVSFGIASFGIMGLNLHIFPYVTDLGYPTMVGAVVMSVIAFTQLGSMLLVGFLAERVDIRKTTTVMFLVQALGLTLAIIATQLVAVYAGFFIYGIGLGGTFVLRELLWAHYFGRFSLGTVRGMGLLIGQFFASTGAPFFGFLFDVTDSYRISFTLFICALLVSAFLVSRLHAPQKSGAA
ncbi:MAG: MFS transporter [Candidatus Binatia bacterium]